ncbi:50S ribosomal protein L13 [Nocardia otitidiscaviarum]|uniref:Large ribosomal subunit protein uL13 n=1 Tax=Nocardia otitidiscaviarum TaxID=1823 RepID=A0A378YHX0_9NOCA|nr:MULTISPECIES: 50S ribosomal protein L13 [Nocardia]MBF6133749.1 50S ribosomal protein L13 [Nocardia otitidiscaviarum]MBF6179687.1 50S ribosomal protein L13 [Nocardia otitidiscaviarum]MBF6235708.1 50S ribosomal protein L13 [Nocardia otitidiscaviarum]MBF6487777.1 50S ribosomal protein L13 [Nocardia otitidiscaviarum]MCP9620945.1 50S ribosomal protein L13 [Nocardia otitidiscaviarum]
MPTYSPKAGDVTRKWYVIDATDVRLGRLAVQAANLLRGKNKPTYAPNVDGGDFVIIINADKISIAGNKADRTFIHTHSGHPGGLKTRSVRQVLETRPDRLVERAIKGMIPKNKLGNRIAGKLKVYAGPTHPHAAQQPIPFEIKQVAQ